MILLLLVIAVYLGTILNKLEDNKPTKWDDPRYESEWDRVIRENQWKE